jgi:outer membrane protein assembly factor BamB
MTQPKFMVTPLTKIFQPKSWLTAALYLLLWGCASSEKPPPTDLGANPALIKANLLWATNLTGTGTFLGLSAQSDQQLILSTQTGNVFKLSAQDGSVLSQIRLESGLAASFSSSRGTADLSIKGAGFTTDNELLLTGLSTAESKPIKVPFWAAVHTPPLLAGGRVFVLGADRSVSAFDAHTGQALWRKNNTADALALKTPGVLLAVRDTLVASIGNRLAGIDPNSSNVLWDVPIGSPRGINDVERLADVVFPVAREGDQVCARSFQTAVACINATNGQLMWRKNDNGNTGLAGDATWVFGTDADGRLNAWRRSDGERMWTTEKLRYRELTAPLVAGRHVVVADSTGRVYWFGRDDGVLLLWQDTDSSGIVLNPVLIGQKIVLTTRNGGIYAFAQAS